MNATADHSCRTLVAGAAIVRRPPVLIRVPMVDARSATATRRAAGRPRRRRLRREVRLAALAAIVLGPLLAAGLFVAGSSRPGAAESRAALDVADDLGVPAIALVDDEAALIPVVIELVLPVAAPEPEPAAAVALPAYVLPEDGYEEASRAGS